MRSNLMKAERARRTIVGSCGIAAVLALAAGTSGCGGGPKTDDAYVTTAPGESVPTPGTTGAPSGGGAAAPSAAAPSTSTAPSTTAPVKAEGWGTLKGQVVFGSNAPPAVILREKGKAEKDPQVCAKDQAIKSERLEVDEVTKGVKNVLVFLKKPTAVKDEAKTKAGKAEVEFDQKNCTFLPHVLGVMTGAKIVLKSSDPVNHNVNAKLQKNNIFNQVLVAGQPQTYSPTSPENVPSVVTCDIHPWMEARWMVLDHPYFAVTDEKGNFEIKDVPAGTQRVAVWQEATGFVTAPTGEDVTIAKDSDTTKSWTIDPGKVKPAK
jgi:plastocyanin